MLMSTYGDGPIIGLKDGLISMGEPVKTPASVVSRCHFLHTLCTLTILDDLSEEDDQLHKGQDEAHPCDLALEPALLDVVRSAPLLTWIRISYKRVVLLVG